MFDHLLSYEFTYKKYVEHQWHVLHYLTNKFDENCVRCVDDNEDGDWSHIIVNVNPNIPVRKQIVIRLNDETKTGTLFFVSEDAQKVGGLVYDYMNVFANIFDNFYPKPILNRYEDNEVYDCYGCQGKLIDVPSFPIRTKFLDVCSLFIHHDKPLTSWDLFLHFSTLWKRGQDILDEHTLWNRLCVRDVLNEMFLIITELELSGFLIFEDGHYVRVSDKFCDTHVLSIANNTIIEFGKGECLTKENWMKVFDWKKEERDIVQEVIDELGL